MLSRLIFAGGPGRAEGEGGRAGRGGAFTGTRRVRRVFSRYLQVQFGNGLVSERVHVVHVKGSAVDLLQEVFELLDENALLEPWQRRGTIK